MRDVTSDRIKESRLASTDLALWLRFRFVGCLAVVLVRVSIDLNPSIVNLRRVEVTGHNGRLRGKHTRTVNHVITTIGTEMTFDVDAEG